MTVTKLDITLAARAARHLYVMTAGCFFLVTMLFLVFLGNFSILLTTALLAIVVGIFVALNYARKELNGWAYVIATMCAALLAYMGAMVLLDGFSGKTSGNDDVGAAIFSKVIFVLVIIYAARALIDYVRLAISRYETSVVSSLRLANEVSRLLHTTRSSVATFHAPTNPARTWVYAISFILSVPGALLIGTLTEIPFVGYLLPIAMAAMTRRHYALPADRLLELDTRPPILFLRSFGDDKAQLWGRGFLGKFRGRTIDGAIKHFAERLGPFVAIANPNTPLPHLGAAQAYFSNDTWQSAIARWAEMAQMIVMVAGRT